MAERANGTGIARFKAMSPNIFNFELNRISKGEGRKGERAFTLIELLVVIAIIGLLAGMVLMLSGASTAAGRRSRIKAELTRLQTAIEDYKAVTGNYPPDNQNSNLGNDDVTKYHERCGKNPLFYELSGCTFESGKFITQNKGTSVDAASLKSALGVKGIENSARNKKDIPWRGIGFKQNQFATINGFPDVDILILPVDKGPYLIDGIGNKKLNPWF